MLPLSKKRNHTLRQGLRAAPGGSLFCRIISTVILFFWLAFGLFPSQPVLAQDPYTFIIQPPETDNFPAVSVQFRLLAASGQPVPDLNMAQLQVFENELPVSIRSFDEEHKGAHFTLVINGGWELAQMDRTPLSRYEKLTNGLIDWATKRTFFDEDSWSVVTNDGFEVRNTSDPAVWSDSLTAYQPNFGTMTPSLVGLESALQAARERVVHFGVDKALLYVTVPPALDQVQTLRELTEQAQSIGIPINVWMVGESYYLNNDQGGALIDMAAVTGGDFFHFMGEEPLPDPSLYLAALGSFYNLTYESRIQNEGTHSFSIQVSLPDGDISGESAPFYINIQSPEPILISPPWKIIRQAVPGTEQSLTQLEPEIFTINIMLTFPDGHIRDIVESRLYVDGRVVDVQTTAPFDRLDWDLSSLTESGQYMMQVEVEDSLGLSARTILTPIQVEVVIPEPESSLPLSRIGLTIVSGIGIAGLLLLIAWLMKRYWRKPDLKGIKERHFGAVRFPKIESQGGKRLDRKVLATLIPLGGLDLSLEPNLITIQQSEVTFGRDSGRADLLLDNRDVNDLHARLRLRDGVFWLNDLGSDSGTWVNYAQIGTKPVKIHPGDTVHFGNHGFRFTIMDNSETIAATVSKYEPLL